MKILAIETSCDDTSCAVVSISQTGEIFNEKMISFDQLDIHETYGGVVPELASREHLNQIIPVLYALTYHYKGSSNMDILMSDVDEIAVTTTPGLPGSLIIGKTAAHFLSKYYNKQIQHINHLHGHLFSRMIDRQNVVDKKTLVLSVSGGHSDISLVSTYKNDLTSSVYIDKLGKYFISLIAKTRDDAIGEVFDKVSRLLGGPYPGGSWIEEKAFFYEENKTLVDKKYPSLSVYFKRILLKDDMDFSFSGMKSQAYTVLQEVRKTLGLSEYDELPQEIISLIAYEFQEAAADILAQRVFQVLEMYKGIGRVALVGGVSANKKMREKIQRKIHHYCQLYSIQIIDFVTPLRFQYCTDNAAMIGTVALLDKDIIPIS